MTRPRPSRTRHPLRGPARAARRSLAALVSTALIAVAVVTPAAADDFTANPGSETGAIGLGGQCSSNGLSTVTLNALTPHMPGLGASLQDGERLQIHADYVATGFMPTIGTQTISYTLSDGVDGLGQTFLSNTLSYTNNSIGSGTNVVQSTGTFNWNTEAVASSGQQLANGLYWFTARACGASRSWQVAYNLGPRVWSQPIDQFVAPGSAATFTAQVNPGNQPLDTAQWQRSTDGGRTWTDLAGQTGLSMTTSPVTAAMSGWQYRVVARTVNNHLINGGTQVDYSGGGYVVSDAATLTVGEAPHVNWSPADQTAPEGQDATFTVPWYAGTPEPSFQWQVSTDGGSTWRDTGTASVGGASLTVPSVTPDMDGWQYRAVLTNEHGTDTSQGAVLTVTAKPQITQQPENAVVASGSAATFTVAADGPSPLSVQWEYSADGGTTWRQATESTSTSWTLTTAALTAPHDGFQYRAVVSNSSGTVTSEPARVDVVSAVPQITTHPASTSVTTGSGAAFRSTASTLGPLDTRWEVSTDGGTTWTEVAGATTDTLTLPSATLTMNGNLYRAAFTNLVGTSYSNPAQLSVSDLLSITAPVGDQLPGWVRYAGTGPAGATLRWYDRAVGGNGSTSSLLVDPDGTWVLTRSKTASDTVYEFTVEVSGMSGTAVSTTYRVREAAAINILSPGSGSVHASGTVPLTGTAHPSSVLRVVVDGTAGPPVEVDAQGAWSSEAELTPGRHTIVVQYETLTGTAATVDLVVWDETVSIATAGGQDATAGVVVTPDDGGGFEVTGTGFPGRTIVVDGRASGGTVGDSVSAVVGPDGTWHVTLAGDLESYRWRDVALVAREDDGSRQTKVAVVVAWPILIAAPTDGSIVRAGGEVTLQAQGFSWVEHEILVDGEVVATVPHGGSSTTITATLDAGLFQQGPRTLTVRQPGLPDHTASVTVGVTTIAAVDLLVDTQARRVDSITELKEIVP